MSIRWAVFDGDESGPRRDGFRFRYKFTGDKGTTIVQRVESSITCYCEGIDEIYCQIDVGWYEFWILRKDRQACGYDWHEVWFNPILQKYCKDCICAPG